MFDFFVDVSALLCRNAKILFSRYSFSNNLRIACSGHEQGARLVPAGRLERVHAWLSRSLRSEQIDARGDVIVIHATTRQIEELFQTE